VVDGAGDAPVILEGIDCRRRQRGDRIRSDELFHVLHVAIGGILGAGAGPQWALDPRVLLPERLESLTRERREEVLVRDARVGDRGLAPQRVQFFAPGLTLLGADQGVQPTIDLGIDAADEETGDRGNLI
jgi:hypothetical protein